jgi:hypothetical protein
MADKLLPTGGESREGIKRVVYIDHDGPNPYATGGETITAKQLNLSAIDHVSASASDNAAHFCTPVYANKGSFKEFKLLWSTVADGAEVANGTNLSARFCRLRVVAPS